MSWISRTFGRAAEWWSGPIAKVGFMLSGLAFVSRWWGAGKLSYEVAIWLWERVSWLSTGWGRVCLLVVGLLLIWYDHHRRTTTKAHDLKTLKGRVLQLRDEIAQFIEEVEKKYPDGERKPNISAKEYSHQIMTAAMNQGTMIRHGFALRFEDRAQRIYHECGLAGRTNNSFGICVSNPVVTATKLREIMADLTSMAGDVV
jgi:hypothetical protein